MVSMKKCRKCLETKELANFDKRRDSGEFARQSYCRQCSNEASRDSRRLSTYARELIDVKVELWDPRRRESQHAQMYHQVFPTLQGISNNGLCCGWETPLEKDEMGHCHNEWDDSEWGWVCLNRGIPLIAPAGGPTLVFLHEYAHLLAAPDDHTPLWRAIYKQLMQLWGYRWTGRITQTNHPRTGNPTNRPMVASESPHPLQSTRFSSR